MMKYGKRLVALGGSLVLGLSCAAHADATISDSDLRAELSTLRARIAELESAQNGNWLNERRAEEVKSLVREVLADADTRASLLENGATAGHNGKHFFLSSDDGAFLLEIAGQIQLRYVANFRGGESVTPGDEFDAEERGFELRRTKLNFSGHIASPRLLYEVQIAVDRGNNSVEADTIVIGYQLMDNLKVWGGEFKGAFLREEMTSSKYQLAVERSFTNELFTLGFIQGLAAELEMGEAVRLTASLNDGALSGEADSSVITQADPYQFDGEEGIVLSANKGFHDDRTDLGVTVRVDLRLAGTWDQMKDFSAWSGEEMAAFIGAAIHYEEGETGDLAFNNDLLEWTVDASIENAGLNLFGSITGLHTQAETPGVDDVDLFGFVVQGGYMLIPDRFEPFIRFEYLDLDNLDSVFSGLDTSVAMLTFGANYYFAKHDAKFTLDLVWVLDTLPVESNGLGLLLDQLGEDDQLALRAQFQLLF